MNKKIKTFKQVCTLCHKAQKEGKTVVFCHGFFDILHRGHVELLVRAKKLGDVLVVGVDCDDNAKLFKGPKRPINDQESRMFVLANLEPVDFIFSIDEFREVGSGKSFSSVKYYEKLRPDIVASCVLKDSGGGLLRKAQAKGVGARFANIRHGVYDKDTTRTIKLLGID